jgi:transcriptional regulator with XRE-family HTH domain
MYKEWSKEVFAKNLRHYMELSNKNQKEMAEIVGVSAPTFNEWLKAKKFPRIDRVEKLAQYFGIRKSDLIEEKITEETHKKNDAATSLAVRLMKDEEFLSVVEVINKLNPEQLASIKQVANVLLKG